MTIWPANKLIQNVHGVMPFTETNQNNENHRVQGFDPIVYVTGRLVSMVTAPKYPLMSFNVDIWSIYSIKCSTIPGGIHDR